MSFPRRHNYMEKARYSQNKKNARARDIPFLLTFDEWWALWEASGKWEQRGWRKGQYCMARHADKGAYEIGNVRICLAEENRAERNVNYSMAGERNPAYGQHYWVAYGPEKQHFIRLKISAASLGKAKSEQMRSALKEYWNTMSDELKMRRIRKITTTITGRRIVLRDGQRRWSYPGDSDYPKGV